MKKHNNPAKLSALDAAIIAAVLALMFGWALQIAHAAARDARLYERGEAPYERQEAK